MDYRLPTDITPIHYDVHLTPDCLTLKSQGPAFMKGKLTLDFKVNKTTDKVVLHKGAEVVIDSLTHAGKKCDFTFDSVTEKLTVTVPQVTAGSSHKLEIEWTCPVYDSMGAIYRSVDSNGKSFVSSQFEACDARKSIPCMDEPGFKAHFTFHVTAPTHLTVISNTPESSVDVHGDLKTVHFEKSPFMSTYIMAFVIGDLEFSESKIKRYNSNEDVIVRVFCPKGRLSETAFALDASCRSLTASQELLRAPFPLPKCDFVPVPSFAAGAMENWGLITFRDVLLLATEDTSEQTKQRIATVISHELAHQWFGNSVSPVWWDNLWLNESFATILEYTITDRMMPDLEKWVEFDSDHVTTAVNVDQLMSTHPIHVVVNSPDDIAQIFDPISYSKGGSVLRMFKHYVGEKAFEDVLSHYVNKFEYSTAGTQDMINAFDEVSKGGMKVSEIIGDWIQQPGFPIVNVTKKGSEYHISQKRFLSSGEDNTPMWKIPMHVQWFKDNKMVQDEWIVMTKRSEPLVGPAGAFPLINAGRTSFMKVHYTEFHEVVDFFNHNVKEYAMDFAGLITDVLALCKRGEAPVSDLLKLIEAAPKAGPSNVVWSAAADAVKQLCALYTPVSPDAEKSVIPKHIGEWFGKLATPVFNELYETKPDTYIKKALLDLLFGIAVGSCQEKAKLAHKLLRDNSYPPYLRSSVYAVTAKTVCDEEGYYTAEGLKEKLIADIKAKISDDITVASLTSLGLINDKKVLAEVMELLLQEDLIKAQDIPRTYSAIVSNSGANGAAFAWKSLREQWSRFVAIFGTNGFLLLPRICETTTNRFACDKCADEAKAFFAAQNNDSITNAASRAVETIHANAAFRRHVDEALEARFK